MATPILTYTDIVEGLAALGVKARSRLLVHVSLSQFGKLQGGAQTLIQALQDVVTPAGCIVMPTFTLGRFDPSEWQNPPVDEAQWHRLRFDTPLYDVQKTPTDDSMSCVYELFRSWPDVHRSKHPHSSMAAWGAGSEDLVVTHNLADRFGETSPLARLYALDAQVLFLGTGYATNTSFHLGEYRVSEPPMRDYLIVREAQGQKRLDTYSDVDTNSSIFAQIGEDFDGAMQVQVGEIGPATCRIFSIRDAVDFAQTWLNTKAS